MKYFGGNGEGEEGRGQRWEHRGAGRAGQAVCRAPGVKQSRAVINIRAGTSAPVSAVNLSAGLPQGTILPWSCWGWGPGPPPGVATERNGAVPWCRELGQQHPALRGRGGDQKQPGDFELMLLSKASVTMLNFPPRKVGWEESSWGCTGRGGRGLPRAQIGDGRGDFGQGSQEG